MALEKAEKEKQALEQKKQKDQLLKERMERIKELVGPLYCNLNILELFHEYMHMQRGTLDRKMERNSVVRKKEHIFK